MSIIEEVYSDREDLARVLKKHVGIRKIVEDLYPDSAHFIYELLQNAEDTGATEAKFTLSNQALIFEHNGRPFEPQDIYAITDIGEGTKANDDEKIGRFGIGFKAVFAYTETPRIWSPTFSFEISELVLPSELSSKPQLGNITRFQFPFNNPKKPVQDAYAEVEAGLNELSETTLLFLSHIESIAWELNGKPKVEVLRIQHSTHHVEVLKQVGGKTTSSSHYLRFTEQVEGLEKQRIAVAFDLDILPKVKKYNPKKTLADQFRIVPASHGQVAVFFPAQKETSGLRFHLHAPFVPELSRASIKETPANGPLFQQLASLAAKSLYSIRDLKLLRGDFLGVLPNTKDDIPGRYAGIRLAIVNEMNEQPLTPTHSRGHAPAKHLLQAKASLKNLLSLEDIEFLVDYGDEPPKWAIGASQKNSDVDRFLSGLEIKEWDVDEFLGILEERLSGNGFYDDETEEWLDGHDQKILKWLSDKPADWIQKFYSVLYRELEPDYELGRLEELSIVRLSNGEFNSPEQCYFPTETIEHDEVLPRVDKLVFSSGKNKSEQQNARKLLEEIGVREVGELEQVEAILNLRYSSHNLKPKLEDVERFISLIESEPQAAKLFGTYYIFQVTDDEWAKPADVYLDSPYLDTCLSAYFDNLDKVKKKYSLSCVYKDLKISLVRIGKFAKAVGALTSLPIEGVNCTQNPDWGYLSSVSGQRSGYYINQDYSIPGLKFISESPSIEFSRLLWQTLSNLTQDSKYLKARYQKTQKYGSRFSDSQLVHQLRKLAWIPQGEKKWVTPKLADKDMLPAGFPFSRSWEWIKAIQFGEEVEKRNEKSIKAKELAKQLGFEDERSLDDAQWFAGLDPEVRMNLKADYDSKQQIELPNNEPPNPDRRTFRVKENAAEAPDRSTEQRSRSVSVSRSNVKKDAKPYLRQQYTNVDGEMLCQVCKEEKGLPFKLPNGDYFFEAVEFLPELKRQHYQNYIALCPNHAAMFKHVNGSEELMKEMFLDFGDNEFEIVLNDENTTIWFTRTHIVDLKAVIEADDEGGE